MQSLGNSLLVVVAATAGSFSYLRIGPSPSQRCSLRAVTPFSDVYFLHGYSGEMLFVPQFIVYNEIHVIDNLLALILPTVFANVFGVFMIRQSFVSIPNLRCARLRKLTAPQTYHPFPDHGAACEGNHNYLSAFAVYLGLE